MSGSTRIPGANRFHFAVSSKFPPFAAAVRLPLRLAADFRPSSQPFWPVTPHSLPASAPAALQQLPAETGSHFAGESAVVQRQSPLRLEQPAKQCSIDAWLPAPLAL
eukprot:SAG31_NODE_3188_length_4574_cov_2.395978_6_plen_107_part_00